MGSLASNSNGIFNFYTPNQNFSPQTLQLPSQQETADGQPQFWCKNEAKGQRVNSTFSSLEDLDKFMTRISYHRLYAEAANAAYILMYLHSYEACGL